MPGLVVEREENLLAAHSQAPGSSSTGTIATAAPHEAVLQQVHMCLCALVAASSVHASMHRCLHAWVHDKLGCVCT